MIIFAFETRWNSAYCFPKFHYFFQILAYYYVLFFYFQETTGWEPSDRGVSYRFGSDIVEAFLAKNNLSLIVRAHQVVEDGYEFFHERALVTIFSAPNYCGAFDNAGCMMTVKEDLTCSFSILPVSVTAAAGPENFKKSRQKKTREIK